MNKKDNSIKYLFILYCALLIWIILFKISLPFNVLTGFRSVNLVPFRESRDLLEVVENILIFVPFGLYLKMLGKDGKKIVLYGFIFGLALETAQYVLNVGASDITDVITNACGPLIGVWIYGLLLKKVEDKEKLDKGLKKTAIVGTILLIAYLLFLILK